MSDLPLAPPPLGQEPVSTERPPRVRPWWGLGDVLLSVPVVVVVSLIGSFAALLLVDDPDELLPETPIAVLVVGTMSQQLGMGAWPFVVSKWKGLGAVADWRLRFAWTDILAGTGAAIMALGLAALAAAAVNGIIGPVDEAEVDNTQFLSDAEGGMLFYPALAMTLIGAPLAEELFFRGLLLRAIEKRLGPVAAVAGSTLVFMLVHPGGSLAGTAVLYASIAAVGAVLATVTILVGRLWPAIVAHLLFNSVGVAVSLGALDQAGALIGPGP
jgi:hypothetical protein